MTTKATSFGITYDKKAVEAVIRFRKVLPASWTLTQEQWETILDAGLSQFGYDDSDEQVMTIAVGTGVLDK